MPRFIGSSAIFGMNRKPRLRNVKVPIWRPPDRFTREYVAYLTCIVNEWKKEAMNKIIPFLDIIIDEAEGQLPLAGRSVKIDDTRTDDWVRKLEEIMRK